MEKKDISRRQFLSYSAALGAAGIAGATLLTSCSNEVKPLRKKGEYYVPELNDFADDGPELKVGVIGCGWRACGALMEDLLYVAKNIRVTALGDVLEDRARDFRDAMRAGVPDLNVPGQEVPDENVFIGFDAYRKVIDSGVDMVIIATPPAFRPIHFAYATEKGVHSFLEKPVAVDPKGYRSVVATAKLAEAKGLSVVTGTQRHHERPYVEAYRKVQEGLIGEITGGNVYWNQGQLWYKERQNTWSDTEWMIRDWVNWTWLSGDCIVEQHVHNIDVFMWFSGLKPVKATAFGGRHRRVTGDQYDEFSVDFEFENGVHLHSMSRQIDGCSSRIGEIIRGTRGYWSSEECAIFDYSGNVLWRYEPGENEENGPYKLEHVDWVNHIRRGTCHVEAADTAASTLAGIMGREAAYTGNTITWDEISSSDLDLVPEDLDIHANVDMSRYYVHTPGKKL